MPDTKIEIRTDDGVCPAHVFRPPGSGPWPGVLLLIDGIGMRPAMRAMGERLAGAGYYVLEPDLFYRLGAYQSPDPKALMSDPAARAAWFQRVSSTTTAPHVMRDLRFYLDHLAAAPDVRQPKLGVTGYCMGGRFALAAAGTYPDRIAAAAAYHPGNVATDAPDSAHLVAAKIKARVYVGAASDDPTFPAEQQRRLEDALRAGGVDYTIEIYPARHGWVPSDLPVHDPVAAERHWQTLLDLLARTLAA